MPERRSHNRAPLLVGLARPTHRPVTDPPFEVPGPVSCVFCNLGPAVYEGAACRTCYRWWLRNPDGPLDRFWLVVERRKARAERECAEPLDIEGPSDYGGDAR